MVRVITVAVRDHTTSASLTGEVQALTKIDLAFRVAGQISELNVTVGQHVTAGQILAVDFRRELTRDFHREVTRL